MDRMLISAIILWVLTLTFVRLGPATAPPEEIDMGRAPAFFPHDKHMEDVGDCKACHHRYEKGENVLDESELDGSDAMRCRTCHNAGSETDARQAFHRQCIQCHRIMEKEGKASGPRTCGQCHPAKMPEEPAPLVIGR